MINPDESAHDRFWPRLTQYRVSDIPELMAAEHATRPARTEAAFRKGASRELPNDQHRGHHLFQRMWLGDALDLVNRELRDDLAHDLDTTKAAKADPRVSPAHNLYSLGRNTLLISLHCCFGARSARFPARLEPETEALLLELLWWRTMEKNDIVITRRSTWWVAGSENHDLNTKTANLLVSAILAESPDYADRALPNRGYDCAPGYMMAGFNPATAADPSRKGTGRADWADGRAYTPADHYHAWVAFMMEYLAERARKGFFLENGAPGYMHYTISYLLLLRNASPDEPLRRQVDQFLDLFWADWALQQLGGLRGGPKTRHHTSAGGYDAMSSFARFYLGGPGSTHGNYYQQLIGDYAWSAWLWELVLDRHGVGSFAYIARGIGEEETTFPRPNGVERTMTGDCESRLTKYTWVTPDYILGTQMDHPLAMHNHLSVAGRWQGLITPDPNSRITTVSLDPRPARRAPENEYCIELMYHSAQHRQVLITQQKRRWMQINPDWFPSYEYLYDVEFGVYLGTGWETREERGGWLFLKQDDAYAAIRIIRLKADPDPMAFAKGTDRYAHGIELADTTYTWNESRTILRLINRYSPIIIEAGRRADYPTIADFQQQVLSNKLEIHHTVATHETKLILIYKGAEADEIVFNAANPADVPTVGGNPINYSHPKTFDAPCLSSEYDSGIVEVHKGDRVVRMDFNPAAGGAATITRRVNHA